MNTKRLIEEFCALVRVDSESTNERNFALELQKRLALLGFETHFDDADQHTPCNSGNLLAFRAGDPAKRPLAFSCHMDTVKPGVGIQPQVHEDRITSDGTTILASDDKAAVAMVMEAIRSSIEEGIALPDIDLVFTVAEEAGMFGAKHLNPARVKARDMFVLDSSGRPGKAIIQAPTSCKLTAEITGKAAHAGIAPENGISAIQVMSEAIHSMKLLRIDEETTANVGLISGGLALNIVAEHCSASFEARSLTKQKLDRQVEHMRTCLQEACDRHGATLKLQIDVAYPPLQADPDGIPARLFTQAVRALGMEPNLTSTGGGSDANIFAGKGFRVLIPAVGMTDVHSVNEYILIEDMETFTKIIKNILNFA